jgi:hypothetical protein
MKSFKNILKPNNFIKVGEWNNKVKYNHCPEVDDMYNSDACVYVWVAEKGQKCIPIYVGRASKGIPKRMKEHLNGFMGPLTRGGTKSGLAKKQFIQECIKHGFEVNVYARISGKISNQLLDALSIKGTFDKSTKINTSAIEENLFIDIFKSNNDLFLNGKSPSNAEIKKIIDDFMK